MKKLVENTLLVIVILFGTFIIGFIVGEAVGYAKCSKILAERQSEEVTTEAPTTEEVTTEEVTTEVTETSEEELNKTGEVTNFVPRDEAINRMKEVSSMLITQINHKGNRVEKKVTQLNKGSERVYIAYMGYESEENIQDVGNISPELCKSVAEYFKDKDKEYVQTAVGGWQEGHDYKDLYGKDRVFEAEPEGMFDELYHEYEPEYIETKEGYLYKNEKTNDDGTVTIERLLIDKNNYRLLSYKKELYKEDKLKSTFTKNYTGYNATQVGDMLTLSTEPNLEESSEESTTEAQ